MINFFISNSLVTFSYFHFSYIITSYIFGRIDVLYLVMINITPLKSPNNFWHQLRVKIKRCALPACSNFMKSTSKRAQVKWFGKSRFITVTLKPTCIILYELAVSNIVLIKNDILITYLTHNGPETNLLYHLMFDI